MVIWALYVIAVSTLLSAAAFCGERAARLRAAPTRWYWLGAILASIIVPIIIASVSVQVPTIIGTATRKIVVLRDITSIPLSPQQWIRASDAQITYWRSFDAVLRTAWLLSSAGMLLILAAHAVVLHGRKRQWRHARILDQSVLVSFDVGPAVVGFLRPGIVVPGWVSGAPHRTQAAIIAHEHGHLEAHDPQLFTVALLLLVAIPWNLPLWWQLRRLRHAIEVDCDARVVRSGQDAVAYSETLITVGERQSAYIGAVAAMSESPTLLEQRIGMLLGKPGKWWKASAAALLCLSLVFVGAAAQVSPPNAQFSSSPVVSLDAGTLQQYVGHYRIGDPSLQSIFTVTKSGTQLQAQITGQAPDDIYPQSATHFYYKDVAANLDFVSDGNGSTTALILHQNGRDVTMPRMDDAVAAQFIAALSTRVQSNAPQPGTEAAVRDFFARSQQGLPADYSSMAPGLAELARRQAGLMASTLGPLGALQSLTFQGVTAQGADAYLAKFYNGSLMVYIELDSKGVITTLGVQRYP